MARPRGFTALELEGLTDRELEDYALSNWVKLNKTLMAGQPPAQLRRLLALELAKGRELRPMIVERLRGALVNAEMRGFNAALEAVLDALIAGAPRMPRLADLMELGYTELQAEALQASWFDKLIHVPAKET